MQFKRNLHLYTAGAVLSIAYGKDEPILDTNAARVLARAFAVRAQGGKAALQRRLWTLAARVTPARSAGDFNQAIMDLGATVCRARDPDCPSCPVRCECATFAAARRRLERRRRLTSARRPS